jgi:hypothetical protein
LAADGVSPGGEPVFVPRLAKRPDKSPNVSAAQVGPVTKPDTAATTQSSPAKKSLSVEEISQALREAQKKQTNATTPAPPGALILRGTDSAPQSELARTNAEISAPVPKGHPLAIDTNARPSNAVTKADASVARNVSASEKTRVEAAPQKTEEAIATVNPSEQKNQEPSGGRSSASPQTAAVRQPEPAPAGWKYLLAAGALLLVALTSACLYIRSIRYVPRPSLISQSLDKEKK